MSLSAATTAPLAAANIKFASIVVVVVVFTLNRSFYPTTSALPPVSFLIYPINRDTNYVVTDCCTEKNQTSLIKVGKSRASVPGATKEHNKKKRHPRNKTYEKIQRTKNKVIPR